MLLVGQRKHSESYVEVLQSKPSFDEGRLVLAEGSAFFPYTRWTLAHVAKSASCYLPIIIYPPQRGQILKSHGSQVQWNCHHGQQQRLLSVYVIIHSSGAIAAYAAQFTLKNKGHNQARLCLS